MQNDRKKNFRNFKLAKEKNIYYNVSRMEKQMFRPSQLVNVNYILY